MYRYLGCGLDNVWLRNGYELSRTESGKEIVVISNKDGLHKAIAKGLCDIARPLSGKEFKFLRKELDMSQRQVAEMVAVEEQTVSLWERDQHAINRAAERLLRTLMKETLSGNAEVRALLERFAEIDREAREAERDLQFEAMPDWQLAA
jgi:DNA-binding transcriptional regulator YiaG